MAVLDSVIVVGAGLVGLLTALGLAQAGVRVTIVQLGQEIVASPRAITYHWSALDGIARLGLLEEALQLGFAKQDYSLLDFKTGEQIKYNLRAGIALRRLQAVPHVDIRWGTWVQGLTQDEDGVTVHAESPCGAKELRAGWLVGADGAGSAVRKSLGVGFEGMTWSKRFIAANLRYDFSKHGYARLMLTARMRTASLVGA